MIFVGKKRESKVNLSVKKYIAFIKFYKNQKEISWKVNKFLFIKCYLLKFCAIMFGIFVLVWAINVNKNYIYITDKNGTFPKYKNDYLMK